MEVALDVTFTKKGFTGKVRIGVKDIQLSECQVDLVFDDDLSYVVVSIDKSSTPKLTYRFEHELLETNSYAVQGVSVAFSNEMATWLIKLLTDNFIKSHVAPKVRLLKLQLISCSELIVSLD